MTNNLFAHYEERPPSCSAVLVSGDTVDRIAGFYGRDGYDTEVKRTKEGIYLTISHMPTANKDAFELTVHVPNGSEPYKRAMLVYGHPPKVVDEEEFRRTYREVKETHS